MADGLTRREFVVAAGAAAGVGLLGCTGQRTIESVTAVRDGIVLFQGDSITDSGRSRSVADPHKASGLGSGYPLLIASAILGERPDVNLRFFNRGVSGNKVPDLEARWQTDTLALKPTLVSLLIGVNDVWHKLGGGYTATVADYERRYSDLLATTARTLPGVTLVIMEPFVVRTGAVDQRWFPEFDEHRAAAARVAKVAGAQFVPLQGMFDELSSRSGPAHWAADGVHPTLAGHAAIAAQWRKIVGF